MNRFGSLNDLYLSYKDNSSIDVYAMGIGGNNTTPVTEITSGNDLPWVKATSDCDVWSNWGAENRDLFIMNQNKEIVSKINLDGSFDAAQINFIIESLAGN